MALIDLIKLSRSYRRFDESFKVDIDELERIIAALRFISSARNAQPLKYILCTNENKNKEIFSTLKWAGYLRDWDGPEEGERPVAYIVMLQDKTISNEVFVYYDAGIAIQTIMLLLVEKGLGGCPIAAINRERLSKILDIDSNKEILCVIALGKPREKIVIVDSKDGNIMYYRDKNKTHFVPKRVLDELIYRKIK